MVSGEGGLMKRPEGNFLEEWILSLSSFWMVVKWVFVHQWFSTRGSFGAQGPSNAKRHF